MSPRLVPVVFLLTGCADYALSGKGLGVTPGGSQDNAYAREIVENGGIPRREHFTAEGIFSEHDLPLPGDGTCAEILCPAAAATPFSPVDGTGEQALVQLGFDTVLAADTFERRPLNVAVAVDVSGSMSDGKLDAVKDALGVMIDQLHDGDQMALVSFSDEARTVRGATVMDEAGKRDMRAAVARLDERGGTDIEAGLALAYGHVAPDAGASGVEHRVLLFTDAQPNVGGTGLDTFLGMARYYSEAGIGLSLFGVGLDMGTELADALSKTRGGSYHFLAEHDDIRRVFDDEFDYLMTPVAYDLDVEVTPAEGVALYAGWGAPVDGEADRVQIGASTLFLSARDGGMGVSLVSEGALVAGAPLATFDLSFETPDGAVVNDTLEVAWHGGAMLGEHEVSADAEGVYKMAGLVDEFLAFTAGADFCGGTLDAAAADARMVAAAEHLATIAAALEDAPIDADRVLVERLVENLRDGGENACAIADRYVY